MKIAPNNAGAVVPSPSGLENADIKAGIPAGQTANVPVHSAQATTQVIIDQSIQLLLEQLAKSLLTRTNLLQQLPQAIKNMVEQILQQALPDEATVSQGLADLLKAQKNTNEQLKSLSLTFSTLSSNASGNEPTQLPKAFLILLNQAANMTIPADSKHEQGSNSQTLLKLVQQLSDPVLKQQASALLNSLWKNSVIANHDQLRSTFQQLLKMYMPPAVHSDVGTDSFIPTEQPAFPSSTVPQEPAAKHHHVTSGVMPDYMTEVPTEKQLPQDELSLPQPPAKQPTENQDQLLKKQLPGAPGTNNDTVPNKESVVQAPFETTTKVQSSITDQNLIGQFLAENHPEKTEMALLKQFIQALYQAIKQQPQLMQSKQAEDPALQQFVNYAGEDMQAEDFLKLRQLFKAVVEAMPPAIRHAAEKTPEVQQLWILKQLNQLSQLPEMNPKTMQQTSKLIDQLLQHTGSTATTHTENTDGQRSLSFTVPLYLGEQSQQSYPAYFHIFHQNKESGTTETDQTRETWLRVCLKTENAGVVDLVFRLYKDNQLNLRVGITDHNAAQLFNGFIPEIRTAIESTPITVTDISINTTGAK